jgi:hypothetical protein
MVRTTVFFDGQRRYNFYAAIPPAAGEEYAASDLLSVGRQVELFAYFQRLHRWELESRHSYEREE